MKCEAAHHLGLGVGEKCGMQLKRAKPRCTSTLDSILCHEWCVGIACFGEEAGSHTLLRAEETRGGQRSGGA